MEQWYAMMSAGDYAALKARVDIDFAPANPTRFAVDDPVELALDIKNVTTLIVKIYEINAFNFYQSEAREVDTAINLDGLAATWERVITYDEPPLRRVRRTFALPEIDHPGSSWWSSSAAARAAGR